MSQPEAVFPEDELASRRFGDFETCVTFAGVRWYGYGSTPTQATMNVMHNLWRAGLITSQQLAHGMDHAG